MDLTSQWQALIIRAEALSEIFMSTSDQLHCPIPGLLDALTNYDVIDLDTIGALLRLAENDQWHRILFLHEGVVEFVNRSFGQANGFSLVMLAHLVENKANRKEALRRFPKLIEAMFQAKDHGSEIVDIVVRLTQCDHSMFPINPKLNFTALGETELNILGLLAKLPEARPSLVDFPELMENMVCHGGAIELKLKALDIVANILVNKQMCAKLKQNCWTGFDSLANY